MLFKSIGVRGRYVTLLIVLLETFFAGALLYREFRDLMRILTTFLGKTHRNPS